MHDDVYCYSNGTLRNKFGVTDFHELQKLERDITEGRAAGLKEKPINGNFDLRHLQDIHKHIFGDIYSWAGEIRRVGIAKPGITGFIKRPVEFCPEHKIRGYADNIFEMLAKDNCLKGLKKSDFIKGLSVYMSHVNDLHPFREGNGRTQRVFFEQLSSEAGYSLDFSKTDKDVLIKADDMARKGNYKSLRKILNGVVCDNSEVAVEQPRIDFSNRFESTSLSVNKTEKSGKLSDFGIGE